MTTSFTCLRSWALFAVGISGLGAASFASAQTMNANYATYEKGYGVASRGQYEQAVDVSTRDANGNRVLIDGVIQTGWDSSALTHATTGGAGDSYSGAGALGGATAIGNNLQVVVNGNNNTVIVRSTQVNNGPVTATNNGQTVIVSDPNQLNGSINLGPGG